MKRSVLIPLIVIAVVLCLIVAVVGYRVVLVPATNRPAAPAPANPASTPIPALPQPTQGDPGAAAALVAAKPTAVPVLSVLKNVASGGEVMTGWENVPEAGDKDGNVMGPITSANNSNAVKMAIGGAGDVKQCSVDYIHGEKGVKLTVLDPTGATELHSETFEYNFIALIDVSTGNQWKLENVTWNSAAQHGNVWAEQVACPPSMDATTASMYKAWLMEGPTGNPDTDAAAKAWWTATQPDQLDGRPETGKDHTPYAIYVPESGKVITIVDVK